jgi:hypothetical protein
VNPNRRIASFRLALFVSIISLALFCPLASADDSIIRIGMIGLDTSHAPAFTKIFNEPRATGDFSGFKVVAGYPGGTDLPASRDRVKGFTEQLRGMGVEIVDSIPKLLERVDVVLLESVDGRIHLEEATPVIKARKPLFIDKPLAGSLVDAIAISELASEHQVPWFSCSSLRFYPSIQRLRTNAALGEIVGAETWGSCSYQEGTPDMFFYGVHGIEALFMLMGTGCETVTRVQTKDTDLVIGTWAGGRIGTYRGIRQNKSDFGAMAFGTKAIVPAEKSGGYEDLCREIANFFRTRRPPISPEETLEIFAFMEAADESKRGGGIAVAVKEVLRKARAEFAKR